MEKSKIKQLRDFIKSHEMRYFVDSSYDHVCIKKAFKVEINNDAYWVYFAYGDRPEIVSDNKLIKTIGEANAKAEKLREANRKKKKEDADNRKAKFEEVTKYLERFCWYDYKDYRNDCVKPEAKPFADAIKNLYLGLPSKEKDDDKTYIGLLERYIKTGTIYTQALSFRKENVVCVKYGKDGAVHIELINGTAFIPMSESVTKLIKAIFGDRFDGWQYNDVEMPKGDHDEFDKK